jgi:hypothetical protein
MDKSFWIVEWRDGSRSIWPTTYFKAEHVTALRNAVNAFLLTIA